VHTAASEEKKSGRPLKKTKEANPADSLSIPEEREKGGDSRGTRSAELEDFAGNIRKKKARKRGARETLNKSDGSFR